MPRMSEKELACGVFRAGEKPQDLDFLCVGVTKVKSTARDRIIERYPYL